MKEYHPLEKYRNEVEPVLTSKKEEFNFFGYDDVTEEDIWAYLIKKKWKNANEEMKLYEIVSDILSLKHSEFMNYISVEALKQTEFSLDDEEAMKDLLK